MSTKSSECCPRCNTDTMPNDRPVKIEENWGDFVVRFWNYDCSVCGWTWANEAQRQHNATEYRRQARLAKDRQYFR